MFLGEYSLESIVIKTGIPANILKLLMPTWKEIRKRYDRIALEDFRKSGDSIKKSKNIFSKGLVLAEKFMNHMLAKGVENMNPKDYKLIMDATFGVHKIHRLESNLATDIVEIENMSPQELTEYVTKLNKELKEQFPELSDKNVH